MSSTVSNWAGNQRWIAADRVEPRAIDELADVVRRASESGRRVKAIGAGHSFTAAASTDGVQVSLDRMARVLEVDVPAGRVRVEAGIRLHALNEALAAVGLAMPNLGDIDQQSIAGAIATATHGTGLDLGNLATTVVGMELVDGRGEVRRLDGDLLRVARVGLGALGIVTEVTLQCVPAFRLHARETVEPLDDLLDGLVEQAAAVDHFELYWMPGGGRRCQVKRNVRTDEPLRPQPRLAYARDKWLGENVGFGLVCRVGRRFPRAVPRLAKVVTSAAGERDLVDRSDRVFCSPRRVRFVEMEYGIPVEHLADAVRAAAHVRRHAADTDPVPDRGARVGRRRHPAVDRVRPAVRLDRRAPVPRARRTRSTSPASSGSWTSSTAGRTGASCTAQRAETLAPRYPQWDDFQAARDELDPDRTFANPYLAAGARLTAVA